MATSSFDKRFILTTEKEVERLYNSLHSKNIRPIRAITVTLDEERKAEQQLKRLLSL